MPGMAVLQGVSRRGVTMPGKTLSCCGHWGWQSRRIAPETNNSAFDREDGDDVLIEFVLGHLPLGNGKAAHTDPFTVNALGITRNQGVPAGQLASLGNAPISTRLRQPVEFGNTLRGQPLTIRHTHLTIGVIAAAAAVEIE